MDDSIKRFVFSTDGLVIGLVLLCPFESSAAENFASSSSKSGGNIDESIGGNCQRVCSSVSVGPAADVESEGSRTFLGGGG